MTSRKCPMCLERVTADQWSEFYCQICIRQCRKCRAGLEEQPDQVHEMCYGAFCRSCWSDRFLAYDQAQECVECGQLRNKDDGVERGNQWFCKICDSRNQCKVCQRRSPEIIEPCAAHASEYTQHSCAVCGWKRTSDNENPDESLRCRCHPKRSNQQIKTVQLLDDGS